MVWQLIKWSGQLYDSIELLHNTDGDMMMVMLQIICQCQRYRSLHIQDISELRMHS